MSDYKLNDSLGFLINSTARVMSHTLRKAFLHAGHDVTPEQWGVLTCLYEQDGQTQQQIGERCQKDKTNITRLVNGLEKRSLIVRVPDQLDRRSKLIYLTHDGREMRKQLLPIVQDVLHRATHTIEENQLRDIAALLGQVRSNLSED